MSYNSKHVTFPTFEHKMFWSHMLLSQQGFAVSVVSVLVTGSG